MDVVLGQSVEGRLIAARWCGAPAPRPLFVFGAIHGDEPDSATFCSELATQLAGRGGIHGISGVLVAPVTNPDGLWRGQKNNARDVDLNRNFPARNWQREHAPGYDPGAAPASEPETSAIVKLIDELQPRLVIAVHQPFACVNWDGPADAIAAALASAMALPQRASIGYPTPGSFGSWLGIDRGVPVITLELDRAPQPRATILRLVSAFSHGLGLAIP